MERGKTMRRTDKEITEQQEMNEIMKKAQVYRLAVSFRANTAIGICYSKTLNCYFKSRYKGIFVE